MSEISPRDKCGKGRAWCSTEHRVGIILQAGAFASQDFLIDCNPQLSHISHGERWSPLCLLTPNQMIFHEETTSDVKWNLPGCSIPSLFLCTLYQFPNRVQPLTDNVCED